MKYLSTLVITGLLLPFLPLSAEGIDTEEALSAVQIAQEEATLSSLEEELSLLDEEFEEFKEELFSLENELEIKADRQEAAALDETTIAENELSQESLPASTISIQPTIQEEETFDLTPLSVPSAVESAQPNFSQSLPFEEPKTSLAPVSTKKDDAVAVDLNKAFSGSPIIYSILLAMSISAVGIWLYSILSLKRSAGFSGTLFKSVQSKLNSNHFEEAHSLCTEQNNLFCKMVACGIQARRHGLSVMVEAMKAEGKRASTAFWQRLGLLNDIAIIAPMIGLLGTVLGMFYAFYDVNRSTESITTLFDGLGISVGTTVAGLIVAILALILHSTAKYRVVKALARVENEAQNIATLIDDRTSISRG